MTVSCNSAGVIVLAGDCAVEDGEALLELLQANPAAPVDWSGCAAMHTAVLQVLMAAHRRMVGQCGDMFVRRWVDAERTMDTPDARR
jgi:hypothetical protein